MTTAAIQVENLTKVFGKGKTQVRAVNGLNLEVQPGQVYGFLGPNGAGKSTTIRMLIDLIHPTSGTAYIYGKAVQKAHDVLQQKVGALVDHAAFYPFLTGRKNLEILAKVGGYSQNHEQIQHLLEVVGMADRADRVESGYSTGMKQRLGIAATLLGNPELIILDEPTNGLDPKGIREIREFIRELVDKQGKTVFLSSHMLNEVEQVCDRVAIVSEGRVIQEGAVQELLADQIALRIEVDPIETAQSILQQHWQVTSEAEVGLLQVQANREDSPHIIRLLTAASINIYQIITHRRTLEEYFLSVTENEAHHD